MSTKIKTSTGWKTVANRTVCFGNSPVGAVQAYYGASDPEEGNWLICDGRDTTGTAIELATVYPKLYRFLGNSNVLPDLRGEFLRGAGTNSHSGEGSGGSVGQHQAATVESPGVWGTGNSSDDSAVFSYGGSTSALPFNADKTSYVNSRSRYRVSSKNNEAFSGVYSYTARPTNTSINWIICAR